MDGEINGAQAQGEGQPQQADGQQQQAQQQAQEVGAGAAGTGTGTGDGAGAGTNGDGLGTDGGAGSSADDGDIVAKAGEELRAALLERDQKIKQLEAQVAEAFKSTEAAEALAKQIEDMKAAADAERVGWELKLAGCRSVRAGRVLLADHDGDMEALRAAEPWLFTAAEAGSTGLEPAGAASGGDSEMERWREIAGLSD